MRSQRPTCWKPGTRRLLVALVLGAFTATSFGGLVAADNPPVGPDLRYVADGVRAEARPIVPPNPGLPTDPPRVWLIGYLQDAACTGTINVAPRTGGNLAVRDVGLVPGNLTNKTSGLPGPSNLTRDPFGGADKTPWGKVIALVMQGIDTALHVYDEIPHGTTRATITWDYSCVGIDFLVRANGGGNVARSIVIEIPNFGGEYVEMTETRCDYDGVLDRSCPRDATYENPGAQPAGEESGSVEAWWNDKYNAWEVQNPIPVTAQVCLNPDTQGTNYSEVPLLDQLVRPAHTMLDEPVCQVRCIQWNGDCAKVRNS